MPRLRFSALLGCLAFSFLAAPGLHAQGVPVCFDSLPTAPWFPWDVGDVRNGASRPLAQDAYNLCSVSDGYGSVSDSFRFLFQLARGNFELVVRVSDLGGPGFGGLDIRAHEGSAELHDAPYMRISVQSSAAGGLQIVSSFREVRGGKASDGGTQPLGGQLPIFLKISREGSVYMTSFSTDGRGFKSHLRVDATGTELDVPLFRAGMAQASQTKQTSSSAFFNGPSLSITETVISPRLLSVAPNTSPVEGGIEVVITGSGLAQTTKVTLAGISAKILKAGDGSVTVQAGASKVPTRGDVTVETSTGSEVLHDAFVYAGEEFLRGEANGDGKYDIGDPIATLGFLFNGSRVPSCLEAADANGDGKVDIGDPIWSLGFLFLGKLAPPAPFPRPGISPRPYIPCGAPATPRVLKSSHKVVREGDVVTLTGEGFSDNPEENAVFFGDSRAETLKSSPNELIVKAGMILRKSDVDIRVIVDPGIFRPLVFCKPTGCPLIVIGPIDIAASVLKVATVASDVTTIGASSLNDKGGLTIKFDRQRIDFSRPVAFMGNLVLPAVQNLSRGGIGLGFELAGTGKLPGGAPPSFGEWLSDIADKLEERLGGESAEVLVEADIRNECINLMPSKILANFFLDSKGRLGGSFGGYHPGRPPKGQCGGFDPINDERDFGWCRFCELIDKCNGIEKWQYFIPRTNTMTAAGAALPLTDPFNIAPSSKDVLYNLPAYCHVRDNQLWNKCKLRDLELQGKTQVPHFPRSAIVVKTAWRTAAQLAGKDLSKHYSYTYTGNGTTYYLTAFHFTTKDIDKWFWADFYIPTPDGVGGCQGSGAGRPACVTGVWANYLMCTNIIETETICGNFEFPECPATTGSPDTCMGCHSPFSGPFGGAHYGWNTGSPPSNGTLGLDFLFSLNSGPSVITNGLSFGDPLTSPCN